MLTCVRAFYAAEGWHRQGAQSCAHWLTWRIGLNPGAAREKVRVARALGVLPAIDRVFAEGRLSYAQVRAVTRIATPESEERVVDIALAATGAQLERICRGFRRATDVDQVHAAERSVRARVLDDGLVRLEVVLSADEAELVMKAIGTARDHLSPGAAAGKSMPDADVAPAVPDRAEVPGVSREARAPRASAADALVHMASTFVAHDTADRNGDGGAPGTASAGPRAEVIIHVGPELTDAADGALVATLEDGTNVSAESAETLRRVACDGGVIVAATDPTGQVLDVGRRTRAIPSAIRAPC